MERKPTMLIILDGYGLGEDYEGNVLSVLDEIIKRDTENFKEMKIYLTDKFSTPQVSEYISTAHKEVPKRMITFSPQVFNIPTKPQNEKLVTIMLPFFKTTNEVKLFLDYIDGLSLPD